MSPILFYEALPRPACKREILRYAGVRGDAPEAEALLDECLLEVSGCLKQTVCYRELTIERWDKQLTLGALTTNSKTAMQALDGCDRAILFASTLGISIDRMIAKYGTLSPAKALLLQAIGAERIEAVCDAFCEEMTKKATLDGKKTTARFSPGYGDFSLLAQTALFEMLDCSKKLGLTLNQSLLMSPSKSVTAIIGIKSLSNEPIGDQNEHS